MRNVPDLPDSKFWNPNRTDGKLRNSVGVRYLPDVDRYMKAHRDMLRQIEDLAKAKKELKRRVYELTLEVQGLKRRISDAAKT